MASETDAEIRETNRRFELTIDGLEAYLSFTRDNERMWLLDTFVPPALEGRGIGGRLARHSLEHARASGLAVVPICPYVGAYIQRHPEYQDLVG